MAERRGAASAYPFVAAFVTLFLLFQQFLESIHQFVIAEFFELGFLLGRQFTLHALHQPVERNVGQFLEQGFNAMKILAKGFVEFVVMRLIFDQRGARQKIKVVERIVDDLFLQRLQQHQKLLDGDGNLGVFEREKKVDQHVGAA